MSKSFGSWPSKRSRTQPPANRASWPDDFSRRASSRAASCAVMDGLDGIGWFQFPFAIHAFGLDAS